MIRERSYYLYNHQGKGRAYASAMESAGYTPSSPFESKVIFIDIDNQGRVKRHRTALGAKKSRLFVYPHAARVNVSWDGLIPASHYTAAIFVSAKGHADILRSYGIKKPIHVAGWAYCPIVEFSPNLNPRRVLFAPIHPNRNGYLSDCDRKINSAIFARLRPLAKAGEIELTVRYMRGIENNGLVNDPAVTFIEGGTDLSYKEIDESEIVVSHQTHAYLSLARGKPVLMMAEETPPHYAASDETFKYVASWSKYKDMLMYPLDILAVDDTIGLIRRAAESDCSVRDWKDRMIGKPFDPSFVTSVVQNYL